MKQFVLQHGHSRDLLLLPHIREISINKNISIQLNSLPATTSDCIRISCNIDGKLAWYIQQQSYLLFSYDIALNTGFYSSQNFSDIFKKWNDHRPIKLRKRNFSEY
jgi:hypothetical protein